MSDCDALEESIPKYVQLGFHINIRTCNFLVNGDWMPPIAECKPRYRMILDPKDGKDSE